MNYYGNVIFKLVSDKGTWKVDMPNNIATVTNTEAFTVKVMAVDNSGATHADKDFGISFKSQLEDVYGDRYSMDISDVSVLKFRYASYCIELINSITAGLTLKLYKARITNSGIDLSNHNVDNAMVELDNCNIDTDKIIYICIGAASNEKKISNSSVILKDCNISNNDNILIGIGVEDNKGEISNSSVTITGCYINANDYIDTGIGVGNNNTKAMSNSISSISDTTIGCKTEYLFIDPNYINNTTLSLDNVIVIN